MKTAHGIVILLLISLNILTISTVSAARKYSPNDVFPNVEYSSRLMDALLEKRAISDIVMPYSMESQAKPMHVYELHIAVLTEIYDYALKNGRQPPPLPSSTPIHYTPTDVFYLTFIIRDHIRSIYLDDGLPQNVEMAHYRDKSPSDVYRELFKLFYKVNRLNGKSGISPSEVYAQIYRVREDLRSTLLIQSKRLAPTEEKRKRLLVTAMYGMHPDGSIMPAYEEGKRPGDVFSMAMRVRGNLQALRKKYDLPSVKSPKVDDLSEMKPIDVFLQTQFIIAELNLLKVPLDIKTRTGSVEPMSGKKPSDVYHEMKHINYMLERLLTVL